MNEVRRASFSAAGSRVEISVRNEDAYWADRLMEFMTQAAHNVHYEHEYHARQNEVVNPTMVKRGGCPGGCPD